MIFYKFYKSVQDVPNGIPSHHLSPLQNQDLIDPKKNGLVEMILLQNQEPEFYMWFISTKSRPMQVGATGVSGELSFTESRAFPLTISKPLQNQDLIDLTLRGKLYYKIKDLRVSQALSLQNQVHAQKVRFCALPADCWGPCLQNQGPTKI